MIFKYIFLYLTMLIPRNKRLYVFGAWLGDKFADNSAALFIEAQELEGVRSVFVSRRQEVVDEVRALGYEAYKWNSLKGIWCQLRAGYAIETNGISDFNHTFLGGASFINLWHGIPLKKVCYDDFYGRDWNSPKEKLKYRLKKLPLGREYLVGSSETFREIYKSAFRIDDEHFICLGQPRNDIFFGDSELEKVFSRKSAETLAFLRKARDDRKKIILYAPTHRLEGKEPMELEKRLRLEVLDEICRQAGAVFIIKKHFYHRNEPDTGKEFDNIFDLTNDSIDTQLLLKYTDLLISDYSSIYIDYLLLDRPMIFFDYDRERYLSNDREMYFDYDSVTPGIRVKDANALNEAIISVLSGDKDLFTADRKKIRDLFFCKEGQQSCGRILLEKISKQ